MQMMIGNIPCVLYGEPSDKVWLFVHGKNGCKEEGKIFSEIVAHRGCQVLSIDLPEHGKRTDSAKLCPWDVVPELAAVLAYMKKRWKRLSLRATSIGAYFSLLAFQNESFARCLFVSPVVDMTKLIGDMMRWAGTDEEALMRAGEIPTSFGETLSWKYWCYAKEHPVKMWNSPAAVLYAGNDNLTSRETMQDFADRFGCSLTIMENGEHWFHTPQQLAYMQQWESENV